MTQHQQHLQQQQSHQSDQHQQQQQQQRRDNSNSNTDSNSNSRNYRHNITRQHSSVHANNTKQRGCFFVVNMTYSQVVLGLTAVVLLCGLCCLILTVSAIFFLPILPQQQQQQQQYEYQQYEYQHEYKKGAAEITNYRQPGLHNHIQHHHQIHPNTIHRRGHTRVRNSRHSYHHTTTTTTTTATIYNNTAATSAKSIKNKTKPLQLLPPLIDDGNNNEQHQQQQQSKNFFLPSTAERSNKSLESLYTWQDLDRGSVLSVKRRQLNPDGPLVVPKHLPLPIFVMNMPKSGSTSIFQYFKCGMGPLFGVHHRVPHRLIKKRQQNQDPHHDQQQQHPRQPSVDLSKQTVAVCMGYNLIHDRPLVQGCGGFSVYTDVGGIMEDFIGDDEHDTVNGVDVNVNVANQRHQHQQQRSEDHRSWCFYPGVHALENIAKYYPHATILHLPRDATDWVRSSTNWLKNMKANEKTAKTNTNANIVNKTTKRELYSKNDNHSRGKKGSSKRRQQQPKNNNIKKVNKNKENKNILIRYEERCYSFENNTFHKPPSNRQEKLQDLRQNQQREQQHRTRQNWTRWYQEDFTERIRRFAADHPTLTYFESPLADSETPLRLERVTGIDASCFGHYLKTSHRLELWNKSKQE